MTAPARRAAGGSPEDESRVPRPIVKTSRWPFPWIWIVPLAAAIGAGYYLYRHHQEREGPEITITFRDGTGLKPEETEIRVRGVRVGVVTSVQLSDDHRQAVVKARLQNDAASIAKTGTLFWITRPDLSSGSLTGLGTIVTGPSIQAVPGEGGTASRFEGLEGKPLTLGDGVKIVVHAARLQRTQVGSPVYYRGLQVGTVQDVRLSSDSTQVNLTCYIQRRYVQLLRTTSEFWPVAGAEVKGGVFSGLEVQLGSLRSLLAGGLTFATPSDPFGAPIQDGTQFTLNEEEKKEWQSWSPKIPFPPPHAPDPEDPPQ